MDEEHDASLVEALPPEHDAEPAEVPAPEPPDARLTPSEAVAGMTIRVPTRGNRKLRRIVDRVNADPELKAWWHVADRNVL